VFDTLKDIFLSIYGAFIIVAFLFGTFFFGFYGNPYYFVGWCCLFFVPIIYKKNQMDKQANKAMGSGELQITSDVQEKAIKEYVEIIRGRNKRKSKRKPRKKKRVFSFLNSL
jgi:hypothetical protein